MLIAILSNAIPVKNTNSDSGCALFVLLVINNQYPQAMLANAQTTLVVEDESATPPGFEKGVGNLLPEMPCTK